MHMQRKQSGLSLIGFLVVLAVGSFFVYCGMKLVPMYTEFYAVKQSLKGVAEEPGAGTMDASRIKDLFFRRLYINYSENVKPEHLKIERTDSGFKATVNYEVRKPLLYNLDVVGKFHTEQAVTRGAGTP